MKKQTEIDPVILQEIIKQQAEAREQGKPGCFLFNRVSTQKEEQETSLEQQEHDGARYAEKKGLHVVHAFRVQETASKEGERHEFNQMLTLLGSDLIDVKHVVFKSADRSSRNKFDKFQLDQLRKLRGISIHYYSSGKVLHGESHYTDELQDDLENLFATHYSRELSFKMKAAYRYKALEKKQAPGSTPPYGYKWDRELKRTVKHPDEEHIVRTMHDVFDAGNYSIKQFADYCNDRKMFTRTGRRWTSQTMYKFLRSPYYTGWFEHPRGSGNIYDGDHEPYITKERFDERIRKLAWNKPRMRKTRHTFSCFVKCSECGKSYAADRQTGASNSGEYSYYRHKCEGWTGERRYREPALFKMLDKIVETSRFRPKFAENLKELFREPLEKKDRGYERALKSIASRLAALGAKRSRLLEMRLGDEIDKSEFKTKREQIDAEIAMLNSEQATLQTNDNEIFDQIAETIDLLKEMPLIFMEEHDPAQKMGILKKMADSLTMRPDGSLSIDWIKPFSFLMRPDVLEAQESGDLEALSRPAGELGTVTPCGQEVTQTELTPLEAIISDFRRWQTTAA